MMISFEDFTELVASAYQHLYDFVYLRTHALADYAGIGAPISEKERGWRLHHLLVDTIRELDPGPNVPPYSREWRRHRLMSLRYVDGLEPQQIADELAISRRQYYREHAAALDALTQVLWSRYRAHQKSATAHSLLQEEISRVALYEHHANLQEVIDGVLSLLGTTLEKRQIGVELGGEEPLPPVIIGHNLLRQVLLGLLGYLIEHVSQTTLQLNTELKHGSVTLYLLCPSQENLTWAAAKDRIGPLQEILPPDATLTPASSESNWFGFLLTLKTDRRATVLIVDDNIDMLALYEHYLSANRYQVLRADRGDTAIDMAIRMQPAAVILDLMMPDQDGWDVLRVLSTHPATAHIPILICSVLKQKELALTLGADAFLEKPINEAELIAALVALD